LATVEAKTRDLVQAIFNSYVLEADTMYKRHKKKVLDPTAILKLFICFLAKNPYQLLIKKGRDHKSSLVPYIWKERKPYKVAF
jgi:hypothetical protein